jgi:hypothetical protein
MSTRGGAIESSTRHCEDGPYQGGLQEGAKAQQIVEYADSHFRTKKWKEIEIKESYSANSNAQIKETTTCVAPSEDAGVEPGPGLLLVAITVRRSSYSATSCSFPKKGSNCCFD